MIGVAIVGCGVVGRKRARALEGARVVAAADSEIGKAEDLAGAHPGCRAFRDADRAIRGSGVDVVVVATSNDALAPLALAAVEAGKHVLVEKPAARSSAELAPVIEAARARGVRVKVGFNLRFHPALRRARDMYAAGDIGPLMYIRARYGHGGRLGYEREWRADPAVAGGGELLDQGIHLIDLVRWFAGEVSVLASHTGNFFWDMPVEDNGFLMLRGGRGEIAWLHASCTEWKNLFSFEVFGRTGKLQVDGLGGSYGVERLTFYRMLPAMGPPATSVWEYPGEDRSWTDETRHLLDCIADGRELSGTLDDAAAALGIVERVYRA